MSLYESVAARLIGTPLQRPAEWLRYMRGARFRREHPELTEWFLEGGRADAYVRRVVAYDTNAIDIGCHIGSFLQTIVTLAPHGRHHAFEPVPHKAAWLRRKFPDVTVHAVALSDINETAQLHVNTQESAYSGLIPRGPENRLERTEVQCRKLDDEMAGQPRIGFVKIDVNGAESRVLRGARALLRRDRPYLLLECTRGGLDDYGVQSDEVHALLTEECGYRIHLLKEWLQDGPALDAAGFAASMIYPFQAFNYAVVPAESAWNRSHPSANPDTTAGHSDPPAKGAT